MADQLLIVDDEPALLEGLSELFRMQGYAVTGVERGQEAVRLLLSTEFDVAIIDVMLPDLRGTEVLSRVREAGNQVPVILLTALGGEAEKVAGLSGGADDYVTKPFSNDELVARVRALLRRSQLRAGPIERFQSEGVTIDLLEQYAERQGSRENLTPREVAIIRYLFTHRQRAVSRQELLTQVWRYPRGDIETRTVENHIARLRQKIEVNPTQPKLVSTVRGEGYRFTGKLESPG